MNLVQISDEAIAEEYIRRFTIPAGERIRSAENAANHFRGFLTDSNKQERFIVCFLNGQNQVITTEVLFKGSLTSSAVYPREVIQRILDLGSAAVVLAHNHPSGSTQPSMQDRAVTKKLQTALESIDVQVLDHIIIGKGDYFSFADAGLL